MELDLQPQVTLPLYQRLTDALRLQVVRGTLKPGDRLPSFTELRDQYGIHKGTVERAHILLEQEGLVVRERGRGTFVASLPKAANYTIGLLGVSLMMSQASPYWMQLLKGIWEGLSDEGGSRTHSSPQLLLLDTYSPTSNQNLDALLINGSIIHNVHMTVPAHVPAVSLLVPNQTPHVSSVCADEYSAGRALTQHLLRLGHRNIGFLANQSSRDIAPRRLAGYRDALQEHQVTYEPRRVRYWTEELDSDFTAVATQSVESWLKNGWNELENTALICQNDEAAVGAIHAFQAAGFQVPDDVSVAGFDGTISSATDGFKLTTMEMPIYEVGRQGAQALRQQISDPQTARHLTLPGQLRVGQSTAAP